MRSCPPRSGTQLWRCRARSRRGDRDAALALLRASNDLEVDYVEVADFDPPVLAGAVRVGSTRLIDNVVLEGDAE